MPHSLVLELQQLATDKSNDITDLLRKALLVATKLNVTGFREWINKELNGYETPEVPAYRKVRGRLVAKDFYGGYKSMIVQDQETVDTLRNVPVLQRISTLVDLVAQTEDTRNDLFQRFTPEVTLNLVRLLELQGEPPCEPMIHIGRSNLTSIIDAVRTTILEWTLKLEEGGILGEGLTFSSEEKERAASSTQIRIESFQGILGPVTHSTVTQDLQMSVNKGDFESLRSYLRSQGVDDADIDELRQAIDADLAPSERNTLGERVGTWIGKMVGKAASGASTLGVGTAGSLLAQAIRRYYGL